MNEEKKELVVGNDYNFYAKVETINNSTYDTYSIVAITLDNERYVLRAKKEEIINVNKVYYFETTGIEFKDRVHLLINNFTFVDDMNLNSEERDRIMINFYDYAPAPINELRMNIEKYLNEITNDILKTVTLNIYNRYKNDFYLYPAGVKIHHPYITGLAYHTNSMLNIADGMIKEYDASKDLVYAGIILHDILKVKELSCYEGAEYSTEGRLLGHIAMSFREVALEAEKIGAKDSEEILLLEHVILAHHYSGNYGSPKRPMILEALIVHFVDDIDSKMRVVTEELDKVIEGEFTDMILACDRERYLKHKLSKK